MTPRNNLACVPKCVSAAKYLKMATPFFVGNRTFMKVRFPTKNGFKLTNHWLPQFHLLFCLFIYREVRSRKALDYM